MTSNAVPTKRIRGVSESVAAGAKALRGELTPAERAVWAALRGRRLGGLRFRCQHPIGPFVLDFCCPAAKLVVEVDGAVHDNQQEQDAVRTEHLEQYGYRVIRFTNDQVLSDLDTVLDAILLAAQETPSTYRTRHKKQRAEATTESAMP